MKKLIYILGVIIFLQIDICAQFEEWHVIGEMPNPVSGGQAVVLNNRIYILGGYSDVPQSPVDWIQEYDPLTGVWKQVGKMNAKRDGLFAAALDSSILILGGIREESEFLNSIEEWSPIYEDSLSKVRYYDINFNRIYPTGLSFNNDLYVFGGYSNSSRSIDTAQSLSYFIKYNFKENNFIESELFDFSEDNLPSQQMSDVFTSSIYLFGGVQFGVSRAIYEYNLTNSQFNKLTIQLNESRAGGVAIKHQIYKLIYIMGGYNEGNEALSSVEIFRPVEEGGGTILPGPELNHKRRELMAVFYDKTFYVFGGKDANGSPVPYIEKLGPPDTTTAVDESKVPYKFSLKQNYPNPFNPSTVIAYEISMNSFVNLKVYDVLGNEVKELINEYKQPGYYEVQFNADNLTSGIYFYKLSSGNLYETKKMVVIK